MMLSRLHAPGVAYALSATGVTGPPDALIRRSLPLTTNAIDFPSNDQKGAWASSVPNRGTAARLSSGWIQSMRRPFGSAATIAR